MAQLMTAVRTLDNAAAGRVALHVAVFGLAPRRDILARMVRWQLARRRVSCAKTKTRSEVKGTTAKPWNQKRIGRARQGSRRAPQFRGGGRVFGPVVRSHAHKLPHRVRRLALRMALSAKTAAGELVILDSLALKEAKTAALARRLAALGLSSALFVDGGAVDGNFQRAAANLPRIHILPQQGLNVYDILRRKRLVLSREALRVLEERLA